MHPHHTPAPVSFQVDPVQHVLSQLVSRNPRLWIRAGNLETRLLRDRLKSIHVVKPVFVCGMARSGTTLILEFLSHLPDVATHRYRDYPLLACPFAWNWLLDHMPRATEEPRERSHRDRILVTAESPEAMEEMLWMRFFPNAHDPRASQVLHGTTENRHFAQFYADHIRKLLLIRRATRYVSKGNYNLTRMGYLRELFPDARFVIPVRDPVSCIASSMKQHRLFVEQAQQHPKAREYLRSVGHFEFGPDRRPINPDADDRIREVIGLWDCGEEVRGWARYWRVLHDHIRGRLQSDPGIAQAARIMRFEDLCCEPAATLEAVLNHCEMPIDTKTIASFAATVTAPTYYKHGLSDEDVAAIREETGDVARFFGYGVP